MGYPGRVTGQPIFDSSQKNRIRVGHFSGWVRSENSDPFCHVQKKQGGGGGGGGVYQNPKGPLPPSPPSLHQWIIVCTDQVCWIQEIF